MFATCSFSEFHPLTMGGIPVRSANGYPFRLKLPYQLTTLLGGIKVPHVLTETWPDKTTITWNADRFTPVYLEKLNQTGVEKIRDAAGRLRDQLGADDHDRLVLLCFEQLTKKPLCHRSLFAAWWQDQTGEEVPELGAVPIPEIRAQQEQGLF